MRPVGAVRTGWPAPTPVSEKEPGGWTAILSSLKTLLETGDTPLLTGTGHHAPLRIVPDMVPARGSVPSTRTRRSGVLGAVFALGLGFVLAGCVGGSVGTLTTPPTTDDSFALTIQHSPEGSILATGSGRTLYDFGPDTPAHSACVNVGCVYQWPPLIVKGSVLVGPGVNRALLGTVTRANGSTQLSYNGHPLYTYILDVKAGSVTGQAIDQDGGPWYVLDPAGNEIRKAFTVKPQ
jgi:predicted lipoprotein with Yx(FWY)xxD motif